jgi:ABC-type multidrug transport system ATPase subunit
VEYAIQSKGLTRRFGKLLAVDGVDLNIRENAITAFLGPNGAGKTTAIRLLLGLIKPTSGSCEVLGYPPGHPKALAQLGAMVESPSLYDHLTGLENVEITRLMRNSPRSETDRVLTMVGLKQDARRPVRNYSLGMRQRLGLALALMGNPRLLVLDEPTNGLDPNGIHEIRELIASIPRETGASVFVSSHILAEIEQVAMDVVVVQKGRIRYQGPMADLGTPGPPQILVRVENPAEATRLLADQGFKALEEGDYLWMEAPGSDAPRIAACLVAGGLALYELTPRKVNLETRFLALLEGA